MKNSKKILTIVFGVIMIVAGAMHFISPAVYLPFFPNQWPQKAIIYGSGIIEVLVGLCTLIPRYSRFGTLGIFILMLAFLPLHVIDVFKENPVVGSKLVAFIRLPFQFVFIAWAWFIFKEK
ncbi:MAG: hypothetical protein JHD28_07430 [Bacteroidia bacterium]|nr:hypothetical protein [Bacteroidia bacterium]